MREITFIDATREALATAMAKDATIFVVGEGIGARGGNFNTTTGLYDLYGPERLRDTPDQRTRLRGHVHRRGHDRQPADRRLHVCGLHIWMPWVN